MHSITPSGGGGGRVGVDVARGTGVAVGARVGVAGGDGGGRGVATRESYDFALVFFAIFGIGFLTIPNEICDMGVFRRFHSSNGWARSGARFFVVLFTDADIIFEQKNTFIFFKK